MSGARLHRLPRIRTDWFRVLADLQRAGIDMARVSRLIDVPVGTIRYWKQGGEPSHAAGHALLELWAETCGQEYNRRPMCFA